MQNVTSGSGTGTWTTITTGTSSTSSYIPENIPFPISEKVENPKTLRDIINNVSLTIDSEIAEETRRAEAELDEHLMLLASMKKALKDEILTKISASISLGGYKVDEDKEEKSKNHLEDVFKFLEKFEENLKFVPLKETRDRLVFSVMEDFKVFVLLKKINGKHFDVEKQFETYWEKKLGSLVPSTKK